MSCECFCGVNHPDRVGICTGEATTELRFSNFSSNSALAGIDNVDVPMCSECSKSTIIARKKVNSDIGTAFSARFWGDFGA